MDQLQEKLNAAREALQGRKTTIIAVAIVALAILEGPLGIDVPGVEISEDWLAVALNGLGLGFLRTGLARAAA